jgi:hypothetical protein
MQLAVTEAHLNDQGLYFPERAQINEESVSFINEINLNVEIIPLQHFFRNYGTKSLYTSTALLFVRLVEKFRHTTKTHTQTSGPR